jgi:hypothetical protein
MRSTFGGGVLEIVVPLRATDAKSVPGPAVSADPPPAA